MRGRPAPLRRVFRICPAFVQALLATGAVSGCCGPSVDPRVHALRMDELATVVSAAETPGPRSSAEVARIASTGAALERYFGDLGR